MNFRDKAGNYKTLYGPGNSLYQYNLENYPEEILEDRYLAYRITVINTGKTPDVTTSTSNANFINQVRNVKDDGVVVADFSNNPNVSSDVFTAIAGTNKELTFTSEGISWQFNGSDVDPANAKNINLGVSITPGPEETSAAGAQIKELAGGGTSTLILHFADNGLLPGKAKIRVKADYSLRNYLGTEELSVFWWDSTNNVLVPIAENVSVDAAGDIIFDITHCSYYVIVGKSSGLSNTLTYDDEEYYDNYLEQLAELLEEAGKQKGDCTIEWNKGNSLPLSFMRDLKNYPNVTLVFNYKYMDKYYRVVIPSSKVIIDESIEWYGPLWLAAHYGSTVNASKMASATKLANGIYIVKKGDTLWRIASKYKTTVNDIMSKNPNIKDSAKIYIGQTIKY